MRLRISIVAVMTVSLALAACGGVPDYDSNYAASDEQKRMRAIAADYNQTVGVGALALCAVLAPVGLVVAGAAGVDPAAGAIGGCALGMAIGAGIGHAVAKRKDTYAAENAGLERGTARLREENARLRALNASTRSVVEEHRASLHALRAALAADRGRRAELEARLRAVDVDSRTLRASIEELSKRAASYRKSGRDDLAEEIVRLERQIGELQQMLDELNMAVAVTRVG